MREIKFRIWLKNKEEMDYNDCFIRASGNPVIWGGDEQEKDSYVLMQYTGLKDKNGKEIYEGDIVKTDKEYKDIIIWEDGSFFLKSTDKDYDNEYLWEYIPKRLEVIGNVYENKDLIYEHL